MVKNKHAYLIKLEKNYTYTGTRSDRAKLYKDPSGNVYAKENTHWDVTYK
jgi:hypothetical protein